MTTFLVLSVVFAAACVTSITDLHSKYADEILDGLKLGAPILKDSVQNRIFGGNLAEPHQFPYQVGLVMISPAGEFLEEMPKIAWCGGALISRNFVLTAGHCVYRVLKGGVILGGYNIQIQEAGRQVVTVGTDNLFLHPLYDAQSDPNDVGLIRLPVPVKLSDIVQIIKLPRRSMVASQLEGRMAVMTGWGRRGNFGNVGGKLHYANLTILPQNTCARAFPKSFTNSQVCVSGEWESVCPGDSGGPLITQEADGSKVVIGIASFISMEGCEKGLPTVFTRVTSFLDWITKKTGIKVRN